MHQSLLQVALNSQTTVILTMWLTQSIWRCPKLNGKQACASAPTGMSWLHNGEVFGGPTSVPATVSLTAGLSQFLLLLLHRSPASRRTLRSGRRC